MSAEAYVEHVLLKHVLSAEFDEKAGRRWMPAEEMEGHFRNALHDSFAKYGYEIGGRYNGMSDALVSRMYVDNILIQEGDELTGVFVSFEVSPKDRYIKEYIGQSEVGRRVDRLGEEALKRALRTLAQREGWVTPDDVFTEGVAETISAQLSEGENQFNVPASDRIVRIDHNQISHADASITELVTELEADNGSPDFPGLRERAIGQIRAGRELIRSGEYRAFLLYEVLVKMLHELIARYSNPTIVALANALLGAVVSQLLGA